MRLFFRNLKRFNKVTMKERKEFWSKMKEQSNENNCFNYTVDSFIARNIFLKSKLEIFLPWMFSVLDLNWKYSLAEKINRRLERLKSSAMRFYCIPGMNLICWNSASERKRTTGIAPTAHDPGPSLKSLISSKQSDMADHKHGLVSKSAPHFFLEFLRTLVSGVNPIQRLNFV